MLDELSAWLEAVVLRSLLKAPVNLNGDSQFLKPI
jgi:hypothetical protein